MAVSYKLVDFYIFLILFIFYIYFLKVLKKKNLPPPSILPNGFDISTGAGWTVPYVPGTISAQAYNGHAIIIAEQSITTTGEAAAIGLHVDTDPTIIADGQDVALVAISILDNKVRR